MALNISQLRIWTGRFGKDYTDRNSFSLKELDVMYGRNYGISRMDLNKTFLAGISRRARILEVGCNIGNQLLCLQKMGFTNLYGIEPQDYAIERALRRIKGINIIKGNIFDIPFKDKYFDVVFTSGVLIHISPKQILKAVKEIHRCSARYVWGLEYYAEDYKDILYRGNKNLLWKADFEKIYTKNFKDLALVKRKKLNYTDNDNVDMMFLLRKKSL